MTSINTTAYLRNVSDAELFQHVVQRLREGFRERYRTDCRYGSFNFVIYNGRFVGIEENLNHRAYWVQSNQSQKPGNPS